MKKWHLCLLFVILILASGILAQAPTKYQPTEVQSLKIQLAYKDVQIAQQQYQAALNALSGTAAAAQKENGWPVTVTLNYAALPAVQFVDHPAPPAPKKPEPKK
jgi:hypothetical protein